MNAWISLGPKMRTIVHGTEASNKAMSSIEKSQTLANWRWTCLLVLLLAAMFQSAALDENDASELVTVALYALVFTGTLFAAKIARPFRVTGLTLVALWVLVGTASAFIQANSAGLFFVAVSVCILVGCLFVTISELARNKDAGLDPIMGAVFGYILIGVTWSLLYAQIELETPGSFNLPGENRSSSEFIYFSLVTLTSLGYGDITPARPTPRVLAGLQAAVGTIYIAVFIGRVISRFKD